MKKFQKCIAIDFDGTITRADNKTRGQELVLKKNAPEVIRQLYSEGYLIIINTLRDGKEWEKEARDFLDKHDIPYHLFNENDPSRIEYFGESRKIAADIYIDDRNLLGIPDDWKDIYCIVKHTIGTPYTEEELK